LKRKNFNEKEMIFIHPQNKIQGFHLIQKNVVDIQYNNIQKKNLGENYYLVSTKEGFRAYVRFDDQVYLPSLQPKSMLQFMTQLHERKLMGIKQNQLIELSLKMVRVEVEQILFNEIEIVLPRNTCLALSLDTNQSILVKTH
jgi:hypothetical protein